MSAVHNKQHRDEIETAQLISRGTPAASATSGGDGGMNPIFLSALRSHGGPGTAIRTVSGTIPARVHPPADSFPQGTGASIFAIASREAKPAQVRVASAAPSASGIGAFFGNLFGSNHDNTVGDVRESSVKQSIQAKSQAAPTAPSSTSVQTRASSQGGPEAQHATDSKKLPATNTQAAPPQQEQSAEARLDAERTRTTNLLIGAVPAVPAGRFENR